jgi:hypothetical protein
MTSNPVVIVPIAKFFPYSSASFLFSFATFASSLLI